MNGIALNQPRRPAIVQWFRRWAEIKWWVFSKILWHYVPFSVMRFVPGDSRKFGPPRRSTTWEEYRKNYPSSWRVVYPACTETIEEPFYCNDPLYPWREVQQTKWPEFGVAEIPEGRLLDDCGSVVGHNDQHLRDFDYYTTPSNFPLNKIVSLHKIQRIPGRSLNLASAYAYSNFYHHIIDGLSRVHLTQAAGYSWDDFDHIILSRFNSPMSVDFERAAGIPVHKIIRLGRRRHFQCETLVQPSYPGKTAVTPRWVAEYFRTILPKPDLTRRLKIYIPRGGTRIPIQLPQIERRLEQLGFETIDPMNTSDLYAKLSRASHVVSTHGAAVTNVILCAPGTRVLELFPSDFAYAKCPYYYYTLCAAAGLPYGVVVGQSLRPRKHVYSKQSDSPFDIKWEDFEAGMAKLLEN